MGPARCAVAAGRAGSCAAFAGCGGGGGGGGGLPAAGGGAATPRARRATSRSLRRPALPACAPRRAPASIRTPAPPSPTARHCRRHREELGARLDRRNLPLVRRGRRPRWRRRLRHADRLLQRAQDAQAHASAAPRTASTSPTTPRPTARCRRSGIEVGYGFELAFLSAAPPRDMRVAYTEPGSPAAAGRRSSAAPRWSRSTASTSSTARTSPALNAGLAPARDGEPHSFKLRAPDGSAARHA